MQDLTDSKMPFSMRKAANLMHEAVLKNLDLDELDRRRTKKLVVSDSESDEEEKKKQ